jgi:hypothetical protein
MEEEIEVQATAGSTEAKIEFDAEPVLPPTESAEDFNSKILALVAATEAQSDEQVRDLHVDCLVSFRV